MKKNMQLGASLSKQAQRSVKGGILRVCRVFCADGPTIRCYYNTTCSGDPFNCCVTCDGRQICA